jgi:phosphoglycerol transferase MdoB-like AlkP superfamily enzyme
MRDRLIIFVLLILFWICFQVFVRVVFLTYNYPYTFELNATEIFLTFLYGLKMDASISGYFLMMSGLVLAVSALLPGRWVYFCLNTLTGTLFILSATIVVIDVELYRHWGFRMNTTPLLYIGSEAMGSVPARVVINVILIWLITLALFTWIYLRFIAPRINALQPTAKKKSIVLLLLAALMAIPIRGSFTVAPMNTGFVFFHKTKAFANHAAINVIWNFLYSVQSSNRNYPEDFFNEARAEKYFQNLYPASDSTYHAFNTKRPNIILFIIESFTADIIEPLGGMKGVAPNLSEFWKEGVSFDNVYSSGDRTDKGIISVLSGYPAQPLTSIIKYPAKTHKLPYLNHYMDSLGYNTSFVYGGDIDFANFRSYLTNCRFDHITTEDDFPSEVNYSKWGVHDHLVLDRAFQECDTATSPFFKVILTLSSHEPFDVPMSSEFLKTNTDEGLFLNSCHYTDSALGSFISEAKKKDWWKETVVMFVADHGHRLPGSKEAKDKNRFRVPLFMIGGAIKKDTIIHTFSNQTDIANTLLAQLNEPVKAFKYSKNILSPEAKSFSVYFFSDGYGFVAPGKYIIYDNPGKQFLRTDGATDEDLDISKAYQQVLYSDYNSK